MREREEQVDASLFFFYGFLDIFAHRLYTKD